MTDITSAGQWMIANPRVGGLVLAGGQSRRMGCDKALLKVDGQTLLLRAINLLRPYAGSVAILGPPGRYESLGVPVIPDRWPGQGPLAALLTGLERSANDWNVFLACDLPLLNAQFIELLLRSIQRDNFDAVVPRTSSGWHPLCAAYRRTCAAQMRKSLDAGRPAIVDLLPDLQVDIITEERLTKAEIDEEILLNVNSPKDWQRVLSRMRAHS
jgi:molybdopterin-guanine dinucleotide biosynthesis protein A